LLVHNKCNKYHTYPKYLGGDPKQVLFDLPEDVHREIHTLIDKTFPRRAGTLHYAELLKDPKFKKQVYETLKAIYKEYDKTYNGLFMSFIRALNNNMLHQ
jgi:hypothetical protein